MNKWIDIKIIQFFKKLLNYNNTALVFTLYSLLKKASIAIIKSFPRKYLKCRF